MTETTTTETTALQRALDMLSAAAAGANVRIPPAQAQTLLADRSRTAAREAGLRRIHRAGTTEIGLTPDSTPRCVTCWSLAPCDTVRVLDGEPA